MTIDNNKVIRSPKKILDRGIDSDRVVDATVHYLEQTFDSPRAGVHPAQATPGATEASEEADDTDADQRTQNRRLTLLRGGVRRGRSLPSGAPVSPSSPFPVLHDSARHDPPLLRFKPEPAGPPVWSAGAGWHDLTQRQAVPTLTTNLAQGWTHRWSITLRHGLNDLTSSVAAVANSDLLAADPIRKNSWHKNKKSRAGLRFLQATGRLHAHESLFERKLLCALDYHGAVEVVSQPFTLTWHDGVRERNHTPDFLVLTDGLITVVNTRPATLVSDGLLEDCAAVAEVALSRGWDHALVVGYPLPAHTIIDTVSAHCDSPDYLGYGEDILDLLAAEGPTGFETICTRFAAPVVARALLQRLIWERQVSVDLATPLEDHSLVALPGHEVRT